MKNDKKKHFSGVREYWPETRNSLWYYFVGNMPRKIAKTLWIRIHVDQNVSQCRNNIIHNERFSSLRLGCRAFTSRRRRCGGGFGGTRDQYWWCFIFFPLPVLTVKSGFGETRRVDDDDVVGTVGQLAEPQKGTGQRGLSRFDVRSDDGLSLCVRAEGSFDHVRDDRSNRRAGGRTAVEGSSSFYGEQNALLLFHDKTTRTGQPTRLARVFSEHKTLRAITRVNEPVLGGRLKSSS